MESQPNGTTRPSVLTSLRPVQHDGRLDLCASCAAKADCFCSNLDGSARRLLEQSSRITLRRDEPVSNGDFAVVKKGIINAVHYCQDGRQKIVGLILPGECIVPGELSDTTKGVAATSVVICRLRAEKYRVLMKSSHDFRKQILLQIRIKRDRAFHLAFAIANLGPTQRIIAFYANCTAYMPWEPLSGGGGVMSMEYERQDIAALLSTTVETVCRVLHKLAATGVIRLVGARRIEIRDVEALRALGGLAIPQFGDGLMPHSNRSQGTSEKPPGFRVI